MENLCAPYCLTPTTLDEVKSKNINFPLLAKMASYAELAYIHDDVLFESLRLFRLIDTNKQLTGTESRFEKVAKLYYAPHGSSYLQLYSVFQTESAQNRNDIVHLAELLKYDFGRIFDQPTEDHSSLLRINYDDDISFISYIADQYVYVNEIILPPCKKMAELSNNRSPQSTSNKILGAIRTFSSSVFVQMIGLVHFGNKFINDVVRLISKSSKFIADNDKLAYLQFHYTHTYRKEAVTHGTTICNLYNFTKTAKSLKHINKSLKKIGFKTGSSIFFNALKYSIDESNSNLVDIIKSLDMVTTEDYTRLISDSADFIFMDIFLTSLDNIAKLFEFAVMKLMLYSALSIILFKRPYWNEGTQKESIQELLSSNVYDEKYFETLERAILSFIKSLLNIGVTLPVYGEDSSGFQKLESTADLSLEISEIYDELNSTIESALNDGEPMPSSSWFTFDVMMKYMFRYKVLPLIFFYCSGNDLDVLLNLRNSIDYAPHLKIFSEDTKLNMPKSMYLFPPEHLFALNVKQLKLINSEHSQLYSQQLCQMHAYNKQAQYKISYNETENFVVLFFRGTDANGIDDILSDILQSIHLFKVQPNTILHSVLDSSCGAPDDRCSSYLGLHSGFLKEALVNFEFLKTTIMYPILKNIAERDTKLYIVGHSLGAALAQVFFVILLNTLEYSEQMLNQLKKNVGLFCFSTPRCMQKCVADKLSATFNILHCLNCLDPVPAFNPSNISIVIDKLVDAFIKSAAIDKWKSSLPSSIESFVDWASLPVNILLPFGSVNKFAISTIKMAVSNGFYIFGELSHIFPSVREMHKVIFKKPIEYVMKIKESYTPNVSQLLEQINKKIPLTKFLLNIPPGETNDHYESIVAANSIVIMFSFPDISTQSQYFTHKIPAKHLFSSTFVKIINNTDFSPNNCGKEYGKNIPNVHILTNQPDIEKALYSTNLITARTIMSFATSGEAHFMKFIATNVNIYNDLVRLNMSILPISEQRTGVPDTNTQQLQQIHKKKKM